MADKIKGLVVSIGADTQPLQKALKSINNTSRGLTNELKAIDRLLKFDPKNVELLSQKQKVLSQNIETTKQKLEVLKQSQEKVNDLYKKGEIDEGQYRKFQREVQRAEISVTQMQNQLNKNNTALKEVSKSMQTTANITNIFSKNGMKLNEIFAETKKKLTTVTTQLTQFAETVNTKMTIISGALVGFGAMSFNAFSKFDKGIREVQTLLGQNTPTDFTDTLREQVKQFSLEMKVIPEEVIPALYQSLSAGVPSDNVFEFLTTAVKLQKGGVTDLTQAVDLLSTVTNAYGTNNLSTAKSADILFTTVKYGKTTITELSESMGRIVPIANMLNIPLEDVGSALAGITAQGVSTSEATTKLTAALKAFASPSDTMAKAIAKVADNMAKEGKISGHLVDEYRKQIKALEQLQRQKESVNTSTTEGTKQANNLTKAIEQQQGEINNSSKALGSLILSSLGIAGAFQLVQTQANGNTAELTSMLGSVEALGAVSALTSETGLAKFNETLNEMKNSAGVADEAYNTMTGGVSSNTDELKAKFEVLKIDIGEKLAPVVSDLLDRFVGFINFISQNKDTVIDFAFTITGLTLALKALTTINTIIKLFKEWRIVTLAMNTAMLIFKGTVTLFNTVAKLTNAIMSKGPWGLIIGALSGILPLVLGWFSGGSNKSDLGNYDGDYRMQSRMRNNRLLSVVNNFRYRALPLATANNIRPSYNFDRGDMSPRRFNNYRNSYTININNTFGDKYSQQDIRKLTGQIDRYLGGRLK